MAEVHQFETRPNLLDEGPHNVEAEMALIGAILLDNRGYTEIQDRVRPEHFAGMWHGAIFRVIAALIDSGRTADVTSLRNHMEAIEPAAAEYVAEIVDATLYAGNARELAEMVYETWARRRLADIGYDMIGQARSVSVDEPADKIIERAEGALIGLNRDGADGGFLGVGEIADSAVAAAEQARKAGGYTGIETGFAALDEMTGGLHKGEPVVLGARPGMGKTAMLISIACNMAAAGRKVAFFSLEEQGRMVAYRILAARTGLSVNRMRIAKNLDEIDIATLAGGAEPLHGLALHIDDTTGLTIPSILARCKKLRHALGGLDVVLIDHLRLIQPLDHRASPYERINEASEGVKMLAKALDVATLAAVQLNRAAESRDDKRPGLSDLRQSGQIEEDARAVFFLYRQAYYEKFQEPKKQIGEDPGHFAIRHANWEAEYREIEREAELIVAKQNNGPLGTVRLKFDPNTTAFEGEG